MRTRVSESINEIQQTEWNSLLTDSNPFVRHEFLLALEESGCAAPETGWRPCHLICESADGKPVGALPLYLKSHSHGEFVFDFAWANAFHQSGLNYYPKLVSAVPFTPATGPRLLTHPGAENPAAIRQALVETALQLADDSDASSLHILFPHETEAEALAEQKLMLRRDCQFHWNNQNYANFDEFLQTFTASKRKKTRRERRRIAEYGIRFDIVSGGDLTPDHWDRIMPLYRTTFIRRGREPYLNRDFFEQITGTMPDSLIAILGYDGEELVACSLCFRSEHTLYGRYWGANRFIDSLHFETCYYQGIEYCIEHGLQTFEPGTQGEHKIARGFVPTLTWSSHWLSQPQFAAAVDDYLKREGQHIDQYVDVVWEHVPYRGDTG